MPAQQGNTKTLKRQTEDLLFACANQGGDPRRDEITRLINRGVDFAYLAALAVDHHVSSLVWNSLKFYTPSSDPETSALRRLHVSALEISTRNGFYKKELLAILDSFAKDDIPAVPLKGITLSEYLYGDIVSRDLSTDVDLLVKESDLQRAHLILHGLGYRLKPDEETERYRWSRTFIQPGAQEVDLHWDITMTVRSRERIEGLWASVRPAGMDGIGFYHLCPPELLLYLSAHLVNSGAFRQLRHVCDIRQLLDRYGGGIGWDDIVHKAAEWRMSGSLYAALVAVKSFTHEPVPQSGTVQPPNHSLCSGSGSASRTRSGAGGSAPPERNPVKKEAATVRRRSFTGPGLTTARLRGLKLSLPKRIFIRLLVDKKVMIRRGVRRKLLDLFLSYLLFEFLESRSLKDHSDIFKRIFFPPQEGAGIRGYGRRAITGAVKLVRRIMA